MTTKTTTRKRPPRPSVVAATEPPPPSGPTAPAPDTPAAPVDPMPASGMVCLLLDDATVKALDDAFPPPDGATIPVPRHVTLNFLGDVSALDRDTVESAISAALSEGSDDGDEGSADGTETISGVFGGLARFTAETDEDGNEGNGSLTPIVALFDSPGLDDIQDALEDALTAVGMPDPTHGFTAHTTLFRADLGDTATIAFPVPPAVKASFTQIALVWGDYADAANVTMFPVGGGDTGTPAEPEAAPTGQQAHVIKHTHAPGDPLKDEDKKMALADAPAPDAPPAPSDVTQDGRVAPVVGPLGMFEACLITEGEPTDEVGHMDDGSEEVRGRLVPLGVATWRTPPIPGGFAMDDMGNPADNGHDKAPIACSATEVVREGNRIMARGPYLDNTAGMALKQAADQGAPIGPSVAFIGDSWDITGDSDGIMRDTMLEGSIDGFVVLPYEAMHSDADGNWLTWFRSIPGSEQPDAGEVVATDVGQEPGDTVPTPAPVAASGALTACAADNLFGAPLYPSAEWFRTPPPGEFVGPTVTDEGQIFGHIAGGTCHIGLPGTCTRVSDGDLSRDFSLFHKGLDDKARGIKTAEGEQIQVGQITLVGGHATTDITLTATAAKKHYDDTRSIVGNVRIVWDPQEGKPWMAGALAHGVTEAQVQTFRAAGEVSVDYRQLEDGKLHLVALPVVPRGGWPPLRALSAGGELKTLILSPSSEFGPTGGSVTDKDWDGSASRFTDAQYQTAAAACDPADKGPPKTRCFLPHHEPDGTINRNGVHAAAQRVGSLEGRSPDAVSAAKAHLRNHYRTDLDEDPPDSLGQPSQAVTADGLLLELTHDMLTRRLGSEEAALAGVHRQEVERLGGKILTPR